MTNEQIIQELKNLNQYRIVFNTDGSISSRRSHSDFNTWEVRYGQLVLVKHNSIYLNY
jgi:hypothetical protein